MNLHAQLVCNCSEGGVLKKPAGVSVLKKPAGNSAADDDQEVDDECDDESRDRLKSRKFTQLLKMDKLPDYIKQEWDHATHASIISLPLHMFHFIVCVCLHSSESNHSTTSHVEVDACLQSSVYPSVLVKPQCHSHQHICVASCYDAADIYRATCSYNLRLCLNSHWFCQVSKGAGDVRKKQTEIINKLIKRQGGKLVVDDSTPFFQQMLCRVKERYYDDKCKGLHNLNASRISLCASEANHSDSH